MVQPGAQAAGDTEGGQEEGAYGEGGSEGGAERVEPLGSSQQSIGLSMLVQ